MNFRSVARAVALTGLKGSLVSLSIMTMAYAQTPAGQNSENATKPQRAALPGGPLILQGGATSSLAKKHPDAKKRPATKRSVAAKPDKPAAPSASDKKDPRIVGYGLEFLNTPLPPSKPDTATVAPEKGVVLAQPTSAPAAISATNQETPATGSVAPAKSSPPAKCEPQNDAQQMARFDEIARKYCSSNSAALEQVRIQWQQVELEALEKRVKQSLEQLDKKIDVLQALRNEIAAEKAKAEQKVVAIIAEMRPDAAAQQISSMEQGTAISVLAGLPPKTASLILNEMQPKQAAQLTQAMADSKGRGRASASASQ